jgi:hypothetical protein
LEKLTAAAMLVEVFDDGASSVFFSWIMMRSEIYAVRWH